jgi:hypothetical protein
MDVCRVTMDSDAKQSILVHCKDGSIMKFEGHPSGLFIFNTNDKSLGKYIHAHTMVSTVAEQKKFFSSRDIKAADAAHVFYRQLGCPSEQEFSLSSVIILSATASIRLQMPNALSLSMVQILC